MNLEEAIKTAIVFENKVRDTYRDALKKMQDDVGKKVFSVLADEEQGHVDYLEAQLKKLQDTGKVEPQSLATLVPSKARITEGLKKLKKPLAKVAVAEELEMLKRALDVEVETGNFYKRMVDELPAGDREFFRRFLEIEEGHQSIVQAEIDNVSGLGYWFDFQEFNLEAG